MNFADLVIQLEGSGFFERIPMAERTAVKKEIIDFKFVFPDELGIVFRADAEDLAEQGALDFIAQLSPLLETLGVHLPVKIIQLRPRKGRILETGESIDVIPTKFVVDDTIPDGEDQTYLRPANEELPASGNYYRVTIGQHVQEIWSNPKHEQTSWEAAMCHTLILVNTLLADAGTTSRLYGLYGGNDGRAVLLTPHQFALIQACPEVTRSEQPWIPYVVA